MTSIFDFFNKSLPFYTYHELSQINDPDDEILLALRIMNENNHAIAFFGINGYFLYSSNGEVA